jgi:SPP1 gp7 family putative phage head morphogenesis protein
MKEKPKLIKGYISGKKEDMYQEQFKGEVIDKEIRYPKELGVEHPFNFEDIEKVVKKCGLINGIVNKITDAIVGEFSIQCEDDNALKLITNFQEESNFSSRIREWVREGVAKGNGLMELDLDEQKLKVDNSNNMFVKRDIKGEVKAYNQFVGGTDFKNWQRKVITFKPNQIAHLKLNTIAGEAYGLGFVYPNERVIENIILLEQDLQKLIKRKAGAPIHVQLGNPGEAVNPADIDAMSSKLQYMTNRTEWVSDGNTKMNVLQFGEVGKNIIDALQHNLRMLCAGMEIPEVMLNSGQLNEGIAKVQLEGWQRKIKSIREDIERIVEDQIFKPILQSNGLNFKVQFVWNLNGETEINNRVMQLSTLLSNMGTSENMKRMLQLEIAKLLGIEDYDLYLLSPEQGVDEQAVEFNKREKEAMVGELEKVDKEAEKEKELKQPEVPGVRQCNHNHIKEQVKEFNEMKLIEFTSLKENIGLNYSDYIKSILDVLKKDGFVNLKAVTEQDIELGMLSNNDVEKLRIILKEGFKKNKSIAEIEKDIKDYIPLKDRYTIKEDEKVLSQSAEVRPTSIARTETLRLANEGLIKTYADNGIQKVSWLAVLSNRTCEICEGLNGQIMTNSEYLQKRNEIHPCCRCTALAVL